MQRITRIEGYVWCDVIGAIHDDEGSGSQAPSACPNDDERCCTEHPNSHHSVYRKEEL